MSKKTNVSDYWIFRYSDFQMFRLFDITKKETHGRASLVAELVEVKKHSMNVSIAKRRTKISILNFQFSIFNSQFSILNFQFSIFNSRSLISSGRYSKCMVS